MNRARLALDAARVHDGQPLHAGPSVMTGDEALRWPYWLVRLRHRLEPQDRCPLYDQLRAEHDATLTRLDLAA